MGLDDPVLPPIRRASREALELQQALDDLRLGDHHYYDDDDDDDDDDAVPPPIRRRRTPSLSKPPPPLPHRSPLRSHLEPEPLRPVKSSRPNPPRNFSHPFQSQPQSHPQPRYANTVSYRNPPRPLSYKNGNRMPSSLRRWSSLETIESVQTTQSAASETSRQNSLDGPESANTTNTTDPKRQHLSFYDNNHGEGQKLDAALEEWPSSSTQPGPSADSSIRSGPTVPQGSGSRRSTPTSIMRKLKKGKEPERLLSPQNLEIEKKVSIDQQSRTNSSTSSMTISSGRPSELAFAGSSAGSPSQFSLSSKDWKSSDFDISGLSESELKKCKRKGINPALYAEMKAARKGRFVSPIGGNTFI